MTDPTFETPIDSGFTPENMKAAEWLWSNLPIKYQPWEKLGTHEKAMVVHAIIRVRAAHAHLMTKGQDDASIRLCNPAQ